MPKFVELSLASNDRNFEDIPLPSGGERLVE